MEHDGVKLPWWEFRPTDFAFPGSVAPPDARKQEGLVADFLRAAARAETADYFISANSLNVAGVLDILSREELVLPAPPGWAGKAQGHHGPQLGCRSRLFGMPLADRHAALTVACSLRHKLPRRALVNFMCRLVLGKGVGHLPPPVQADGENSYPLEDEVTRRQGGKGLCACGRRIVGRVPATSGDAAAAGTSTACRSCLARREWLDSISARLLVVACRKLLWDRALPEDEARAVDRCLSALSDTLGEPSETQSKSSRDLEAPPSDGRSLPARALAVERVGVSAVRAGLRRRRSQAAEAGGYFAVDYGQNHGAGTGAAGGDGGGALAVDSEARFTGGGAQRDGGLLGMTPPWPRKKAATGERGGSPSSARGEHDCPGTPSHLEGDVSSSAHAIGGGRGQASGAEQPKPTTAATAASAAAIVGGEEAEAPSSSSSLTEGGAGEAKDPDCLPPAIRQTVSSVAEKVAAAGARGATSTDVQRAAAATMSLLQEAMKLPSNQASSATNTRPGGAPSKRPSVQQQQQQQPLEAVCSRLGLDVSRGKGAGATAAAATATAGCGDDLVMAVCDGFVTPALSLRNCLAFVRAVLVPRARALTTPASRVLVTAVSGIGKARPGVVIDGLVLPLLCEGNPSAVGSAQCELCTRLIKQVLPKHTLEALLVGLCGTVVDDHAQPADGWGEGPHGRGGGGGSDSGTEPGQQQGAASRCVWTELTMPVMTAALNLKPTLSDQAIAALVRGVEAASEQPKLQKSLKFTTLVHSLVTRYGLQLKPHVPMLRAAVGRCSTFMVKAVLAALQRLEK